MMKCNPWTAALVGAGLVSVPALAHAEEKITMLQTALASTTLSGYVDTSAHWNPGTGNANLPIYTANGLSGTSKADGFNLNAVVLTLNHPAGEETWSAGYNAELIFGPDAVFYNNSPLSSAGDFALKDTYVDLHAPIGNGLSVKIGNFTEIVGYEVFESGSNPNYTRSYGYEIEPTQMTGVLLTYPVCPMLFLSGAIANTWSAGLNARAFPAKPESYKTYSGTLTLVAPTNSGFLSGSTLSGGAISGFDAVNGVSKDNYYVGGTIMTPVTGLKAGFAFDYLNVHGRSGETWVLGGYLAYQATEKLAFYARGEYLRDRGAQKVFSTFADDGVTPVALAPDKALELTGTVQYDLWKNVMTRLEVRWDHSLSGQGVWGGTTPNTVTDGEGGILGNGNQKNAVVLIANVIYKF